MTTAPTVSVIIPARNEAADIRGCIEAIAAQTWPTSDLEILLADGSSEDDTVAVATKVAQALSLRLTVVPNPARSVPCGLNAAVARCRGRIVVRIDARSRPRPGHIAGAVRLLDERADVGVVGGGQHALPRGGRVAQRAIARALSNRYSTGFARYRRSSTPGPADTVWMGSFRRDDLHQLTGWDEAFTLNQDWDLAERYRQSGLVVWFDPALDADYLPRPSYRQVARQHFRFGRAKGTWWMRGRTPAPRQIVLLLLPPVALGIAASAAWSFGALPVALVGAAGALLIDAVGSRSTATVSVRIGAVGAAAVSCGAWWIGVVAGAVGEVVGLRHAYA